MSPGNVTHRVAPLRAPRPRQRTRGGRVAHGRRKSWLALGLARGRAFARGLGRAPTGIQVAAGLVVLVMLSVAVNWIYQVLRKPSELLFPVSTVLYKTPTETWREYAPLFRHYSTPVMTPDLLAAMAQVEGSGNPVARTYWRWSWKLHPFEIYRPASSAVGMYQITDGTFAEARHFCIREHAVAQQGEANDGHGCWFNGLYSRVMPAHAVELTAAYLDHGVASILGRHPAGAVSLRQKQTLAAMIHLCGAGAGDAYVRHGFKLTPGQRCGDHDVRSYLARVAAMKTSFDRIAAQD
jgi:hypothetical protein